jgi:hypothetical protein
MAKKKNGKQEEGMAIGGHLDTLEAAKFFGPFLDEWTGAVFITAKVRDEQGNEVGSYDVPLANKDAEDLIQTLAVERIRRTLREKELKDLYGVFRSRAKTKPPRKPVSSGMRRMGNGQPDADDFAAVLIKEIEEEDLDCFLTEKEVPSVSLPGDPEWEHYPINSERVKDWMFMFGFSKFGKRAKEADLREVLRYLRADAYAQGVRMPNEADKTRLAAMVDNNLVFTAVDLWTMGDEDNKPRASRKVKASEAYKDMRTLLKDAGYSLDDWPKSPAHVSKILSAAPEVLKAMGLEFSVERRNEGSYWIFTVVATEAPSGDTEGGVVTP